MKGLRIVADEHGFAMSARRITLSTVGVLPALERLATEPFMPNLAISLHATTEEQRDLLVPINRKYPAEGVARCMPPLPAEASRADHIRIRDASDDVNDTPEDARRLVELLNGIKGKVNLLPLNEAAGIPYERPGDDRVNRVRPHLSDHGVDGLGPQEPRPRYPRRMRSADYGVDAKGARRAACGPDAVGFANSRSPFANGIRDSGFGINDQ